MKSKRSQHLISIALSLLTYFGCQAQDLPSAKKFSNQENIELRQLIEQEPPTNLPYGKLSEFFQKQEEASFKLNDQNSREKILRNWMKAQPENISPRWNLGMSLIFVGGRAQEGFELMEQIYRDTTITKDAIATIRVRIKLAEAYLEYGQYQKASQMLDESNVYLIEDLKKPRGPEGRYFQVRAQMEYFSIKARLYHYQGKLKESLKFMNDALEKGRNLVEIHDRNVSSALANFSRNIYANETVNLAHLQMKMGELNDAENTLRDALALYIKFGFGNEHLWHLYRTTADLYIKQERYEDAHSIATQVQNLIKQNGLNESTQQYIWTSNRVVKSYAGLNQWQKIVDLLEQLDKSIADKPALRPLVALTEYRAFAYIETSQYQKAEQWYRGHLNWVSKNIGADSYQAALSRGMYAIALAKNPIQKAKAAEEFERSFKTLSHSESLPDIYQEDPFDLKVKRKIFASYIEFLSNNLSNSVKSDENSKNAFLAATALVNSSVQRAIGEAAARNAISLPGIGDIARADQDAKSELVFLKQYISESAQKAEVTNPQIISAMHTRIAELEKNRKEFKLRIEKDFPDYYQLLQPKIPSSDEVSKALKPGEYFVAIVPVEAATYVFGLSPDGSLHFTKSDISQNKISESVKNIRKTLDVAGMGVRAPKFRHDESYSLYQKLLEPQRPFMSGASHLIIATNGSLGQIPFAVLLTKPLKNDDEKDVAWLIKEQAISHISSPQALLALRKLAINKGQQETFIAWGDPLFTSNKASNQLTNKVGRTEIVRSIRSADLSQPRIDPVLYNNLPSLPETRDEVLALAKLLKSDLNQDVFLGKNATRQSVIQASDSGRLKQKRIIVFATHGLLAGDLPHLTQPALAMAAPENSNDSPLLTLQDVLDLKLNADWVILSACNTAGADGRSEEALSGMARGFFYAGARSLLVTHWSVESESAMMITTETLKDYEASQNLSRAQSLRKGMLKVMSDERYSHPAFWAPYAIVGEGAR